MKLRAGVYTPYFARSKTACRNRLIHCTTTTSWSPPAAASAWIEKRSGDRPCVPVRSSASRRRPVRSARDRHAGLEDRPLSGDNRYRCLRAEHLEKLERAKGFEPSTPTLARSCSTPELHPHPIADGRLPGRQSADLCQMRPANATARYLLGRPLIPALARITRRKDANIGIRRAGLKTRPAKKPLTVKECGNRVEILPYSPVPSRNGR